MLRLIIKVNKIDKNSIYKERKQINFIKKYKKLKKLSIKNLKISKGL